MSNRHDTEIDVTVVDRIAAADGVAVLDLVAADGVALPAWTPGAHIDLILPDGTERQYSLCGIAGDDAGFEVRGVGRSDADAVAAGGWRVAVLDEPEGRGGSAWLHRNAMPGTALRVRGPRNHFALEPSQRYLFIAGGIGITPLLSMIRQADSAGADWELHYAGRRRNRMAFVDALLGRHPDRVRLYPADEGERLDLDRVLGSSSPDTLVYACGPTRLLDGIEQRCADRPGRSLHLERFQATPAGAPVLDGEFEVELQLSGMTLTVPPEKSVLDVAEEHGVLVLSSCREGTCGTCETPVVEGEVDHRDSVLTPDERADGRVMMICVSRAACPRLVLEL